MSTLLALDLARITRQHVDDGVAAAPFYQRFGDAVKHVIRAIHAIPTLFRGVSRGAIEVYLGRAGGTPEHVAGRFRTHHDSKDHAHGAVLLEGDTESVISWEGSANRILRGLERRGLLCVANILAGENGPTPSTKTSVVYMTWREIPRVDIDRPSRSDVTEIAEEVASSVHEVRPAKQIATAMAPITRPGTEYADMQWHPAHAD